MNVFLWQNTQCSITNFLEMENDIAKVMVYIGFGLCFSGQTREELA